MGFRDWFRPPRHVLAIFLAVAVVSAGALGYLAWLLLQAVRIQRQQERLEQAADRAGAIMQGALADLELQLGSHPTRTATPPAGVLILSAGPDGIKLRPPGALIYYPEATQERQAAADYSRRRSGLGPHGSPNGGRQTTTTAEKASRSF